MAIRGFCGEQREDLLDASRGTHEPVEQVASPCVAVAHVRGALRVHLQDGVVTREAVEHLKERPRVPPSVREDADVGAREPLPDGPAEMLGAAVYQGDDEVHFPGMRSMPAASSGHSSG